MHERRPRAFLAENFQLKGEPQELLEIAEMHVGHSFSLKVVTKRPCCDVLGRHYG